MVSKGRAAAYKQTHARILLLSDENQADGAVRDQEIARALKVGSATVERVHPGAWSRVWQPPWDANSSSTASEVRPDLPAAVSLVAADPVWPYSGTADSLSFHRTLAHQLFEDAGLMPLPVVCQWKWAKFNAAPCHSPRSSVQPSPRSLGGPGSPEWTNGLTLCGLGPYHLTVTHGLFWFGRMIGAGENLKTPAAPAGAAFHDRPGGAARPPSTKDGTLPPSGRSGQTALHQGRHSTPVREERPDRPPPRTALYPRPGGAARPPSTKDGTLPPSGRSGQTALHQGRHSTTVRAERPDRPPPRTALRTIRVGAAGPPST